MKPGESFLHKHFPFNTLCVVPGYRSRGDHWPQCGRAVSYDIFVTVPESQTEAWSPSQTQTQPQEGARIRARWVTYEYSSSLVFMFTLHVIYEMPTYILATRQIHIVVIPEFQVIGILMNLVRFDSIDRSKWSVTVRDLVRYLMHHSIINVAWRD